MVEVVVVVVVVVISLESFVSLLLATYEDIAAGYANFSY